MTRGEMSAWACAVLGLIGSVIGWAVAPEAFARAWLASVDCWLMLPLGAMALVLAHALTGGQWGVAARPGLAMGISLLPVMLLALIPVCLLLPHAYHWAKPEEVGHVKNAWWLNPHFYFIRMAIYAVVWAVIGLLVWGGRNPGRLAAPALIVLAFSFTFAFVDLSLSVEDFNSNIWGMLRAASAGMFALSFATLVVAPVAPRGALGDLSKILLALVVLWTYLDFMQLLIVWESDLATDSGWYVHRMTMFWGAVAVVIEIFRFAVPFLVLVRPKWQQSEGAAGFVCILLIATGILRSWWIVLPAYDRGSGLLDVVCMLALGGISAGMMWRAVERPDPAAEALANV